MYLYPTEQGERLNRPRLDSSPLGLFRVKSVFFFFRSYTLPRGCKMEDVTSNLSADGVLMITAAKTEFIQDGSRKVPIEMKKRT